MDKVLKVAAFFCALILILAVALTFFGVINLNIINNQKIPVYFEFYLNFMLFMINMFFIFSTTLKIFDKRIIKIMIGYAPIYLFGVFIFGTNIVTTTLIPFIYCFLLCRLLKIKISTFLKRFATLVLVIGIYQQLSGYIKIGIIKIDYFHVDSYTAFIYSLDLYLVLLLLYKEVKNNGDFLKFRIFMARRMASKFSFSFEKKSISKDDKQSEDTLKENFDLSKMSLKQRLIFILMSTAFQALQLVIVLIIGMLNNVFFETILMLSVFFISKSILKTCWHSDTLFWCSIATFASFYILTKITLPFSISLFLSIFLSCAFTYGLYLIGSREEKIEKAFDEIEKINAFSIGACSQDQLLKRCREVGLSKEDSGLAVMLFVDKINIAKESEKLGYCEQSLRNKKLRLKKRLCLEYIKK